MIEVECKLKLNNDIEKELLNLGFIYLNTVRETDSYYDSKNGDIRNGDKALRLRETVNLTTGEAVSEINFKGPKYDNVSVTRPEYETKIKDATILDHILNELGYFKVPTQVIKTRKSYNLGKITACLDNVEGLGNYLELEIIVDSDSQRSSALSEISDILSKLGYSIENTTTTSYLSALMRQNQ